MLSELRENKEDLLVSARGFSLSKRRCRKRRGMVSGANSTVWVRGKKGTGACDEKPREKVAEELGAPIVSYRWKVLVESCGGLPGSDNRRDFVV